MNAEPWRRECDVAVAAVREGASLAREMRQRFGGASLTKPDQSPVTVADLAVQALIADRLGEAFPHAAIVAEEDASAFRGPAGQTMLESVHAALRRRVPTLDAGRILDLIDRGRAAPAERFWTLDPVDGTQGFVRGDQYVVALALIVQAHVVVSAIGCPALPPIDRATDPIGWIVCAVRGRGAWAASLHGQEFNDVRVSSCRDPRAARVLRSFEAAHIDLARFDPIMETLGVQAPAVLMDSQAKHALIAAGRADLLIRMPSTKALRDKIWDQAAGSLIIEEAGGRVTDLNGAPLDFGAGRLLTRNEGVIASNGLLHDAVVDAIQSATMKP